MAIPGLCKCTRMYKGGSTEGRQLYHVGDHAFTAHALCLECDGRGIPTSADEKLAARCWFPAREPGRA